LFRNLKFLNNSIKRRQSFVAAALDALEKELGDDFPKVFRTITTDNGVEFSDYEALERSCLFEQNWRKGVQMKTATGLYAGFFQRGQALPRSPTRMSQKHKNG
jgi:IS30 family transposase